MITTVPDVIKYNLDQDYVDVSPQTVYTNNTDCFSGSGDVPIWMYQSLATMLSCTSSELSGRIVANLGETKTVTTPSIIVSTDEDVEGVRITEGLRSDTAGQDVQILRFLVKNVRTDKDITLVTKILLRIRYLLDCNVRQFGTPVRSPDLDIVGNSFVKSYFRCFYTDFVNPAASEAVLGMYVVFFWQFGTAR